MTMASNDTNGLTTNNSRPITLLVITVSLAMIATALLIIALGLRPAANGSAPVTSVPAPLAQVHTTAVATTSTTAVKPTTAPTSTPMRAAANVARRAPAHDRQRVVASTPRGSVTGPRCSACPVMTPPAPPTFSGNEIVEAFWREVRNPANATVIEEASRAARIGALLPAIAR